MHAPKVAIVSFTRADVQAHELKVIAPICRHKLSYVYIAKLKIKYSSSVL